MPQVKKEMTIFGSLIQRVFSSMKAQVLPAMTASVMKHEAERHGLRDQVVQRAQRRQAVVELARLLAS